MRDTILIVEDDEMICQGIVDALQLRNWKTDVATGLLFAGKSEPLRRIRFCSYQRMTMKAILSKDSKQAVMTMW